MAVLDHTELKSDIQHCVRACVRVRVRACARVCVCVCVLCLLNPLHLRRQGIGAVQCATLRQNIYLEPCFRHKSIMNNYFKHDNTDIGTLLSGACSGKCIALSKSGKSVYADRCRDPAALGWAMRAPPLPPLTRPQ